MEGNDGGYPPNTLARATVFGVPGVLVLRRYTQAGYDWAFSSDPERGIPYTCAGDWENIVTDIEVIDI